MKKKIFTLLSLGVLLSFMSVTVNAQGIADPTSTLSLSNHELWVGCEYTLTIDLVSFPAAGTTDGNLYISYPTNILTTLDSVIPLEAGQTVYSIPFTITKNDVSRPQNAFQNLYSNHAPFFNFYLKDASGNSEPTNVIGWSSIGGIVPGPSVSQFTVIVPPTYSFGLSRPAFPEYKGGLTFKLTNSDKGANMDYTLYRLNGEGDWDEAKLNGQYLKSANFKQADLLNLCYILLWEEGSCLEETRIDFCTPEIVGSPFQREVILTQAANLTINKGAGRHMSEQNGSFQFDVTLTGANAGKVPEPIVNPVNDDDLSGYTAVVTEYQGSDKWAVKIFGIKQPIVIGFNIIAGNDVIAGSSLWADAGQVFISAVAAGSANIYTVTGSLVKTVAFAAGETTSVALPAGFYVAVINGQSYKFIVK